MDPVIPIRLPAAPPAPYPPEPDPRAALAASCHAVSAAARRVRGRHDGEAVHDLRVACRRLEAALWLWEPMFDEQLAARLRARIARMRRTLSRARDAEVAVELLEREAPPLEHAPLPRVVRWLERRRRLRDRERRRVARLASVRRIERIESDVEALAASMAPPSRAAAGQARQRLEERLDGLRAQLEEPHPRVHPLRIAIKKCRYTLESWRAVTAVPASFEIAPLTAAQRRLGRLRDAGLLAQRLAVRERRWRARGHWSAQQWAAARRDALRRELIAEWQAFQSEWRELRSPRAHPDDRA